MLPKIPHKQTKRTQEIVAFRGLHRTQNTQDGDLCDATNLSTAQYPTITQRGKRTEVYRSVTPTFPPINIPYDNPTDIFAWDGHLVVVDGGILYFDGEALDNVQQGRKQFAVVNTKLCIWPDKTYIDLTNGQYGPLAQSIQTSGSGSITITGSTFTADISTKYAVDVIGSTMYTSHYMDSQSEVQEEYNIYTYGTNKSAVEACWATDHWDMNALSAIQTRKSPTGSYNYINAGGSTVSVPHVAVGDIFIPSKTNNSFDYVLGKYVYSDYIEWPSARISDTYPNRSNYNSDGYYAVVKEAHVESASGRWTSWMKFDVYHVNSGLPQYSDVFHVGEYVNFVNLPGGDITHVAITAIDDSNYKLTFANGTFTNTGTFSDPVVKISQDIPDLDYICEKDNRLWGVSNSQENSIYNADTQSYDTFTSRAIYASALGDPTDWWNFSGIDSDSYQVAVGSEGDFTGICSYGNAVCCWKEDTLHKILGSYPSEYYMHTSHIEGVADGSYRSLTIVNEVLYYNGATGIYAYTGSTPSLIGYPLGTLYKDVSAGSNGLRWYFSGTKPDETQELVVYDLTHRIWTREDDSDAVAFAMIGSDMYMLVNSNDIGVPSKIYLVEQGDDPDVEWSAEFVPFDETALIRKHYLRIALRLDMAAGSHVTVEVSKDNGTFQTLLDEDAVAAKAKVVQIPPNRVDRFTVRVSGTGNVRIREFMREFIPGSERV